MPARRPGIAALAGMALMHAFLPAQSLDEFHLPAKSAFPAAMPRYPNVWFYVDARLAPSYESAIKLVTEKLSATLRAPQYYPPFDNPEGCDHEVRIEHLQSWIDPAHFKLTHAHAFHMRYYYTPLARPGMRETSLNRNGVARSFFRFAASVLSEKYVA